MAQIDHLWRRKLSDPSIQHVMVFILAMVPYLLLPGKPFIHDAPLAILDNKVVQQESLLKIFVVDFWGYPLKASFGTASYRPLVSLTFALQARFFGNSAALFHLIDMMLHALSSVLLLLLLKKFHIKKGACFFAALLFAVHPVQSEAVSSLVGRADLMAGLSLIAAIIFHMKAKDGKWPWLWESGALLAMTAGFFCKEYAVSFPFILVALDMALWGGRQESIKDRRRQMIIWFISVLLLGGYLLIRYLLIGRLGGVPMIGPTDNPLYGRPVFVRWINALWLLLFSMKLLVFPHPLNHHYVVGSLPIAESLLDLKVLGGLALLIFLLVVSLRSLWKDREVLLPVASVLLVFTLGPSLNTVSLAGVLFAERWLYIPVAGLAMMAAWLSDRSFWLRRRRYLLRMGQVSLLFIFSLMTIARVQDWSSIERLARSSLRSYPGGAKVWNELGLSLGLQEQHEAAARAFKRSIDIQPEDPRFWKNYAVALGHLGKHAEAAKAWRRVLELSPHDIGVLWKGLGLSEFQAGHWEEASEALRQACDLLPQDEESLFYLGRSLLRSGKAEEAVQLLERNLGSFPQAQKALRTLLGEALLRLAQLRWKEGLKEETMALAHKAVHLEALPPEGLYLAGLIANEIGETRQAHLWFQQALIEDPALLRKKHKIAIQLEEKKRYREAAEMYQQILAYQPNHVPTLFNLGRILLLSGRPKEVIQPLQKGLAHREDQRARALLNQAMREAASAEK